MLFKKKFDYDKKHIIYSNYSVCGTFN